MESVRLRRIFHLALPIIGGMISQNVLNLVDTAMVGSLGSEPYGTAALGNAALAAVGLGGFATFMCQAVILGVSTGVQAMASRRKGEGRTSETALALNGGITAVLLAAIPLSIVLWFLVPYAYPWLNSDPLVQEHGIPYLRVRIMAIVFVGINFAFRGYWNAVDLSRLYMSTLIVMHSCNILLNYMLIFGKFGAPQLGVTGAGIGTSLSTAIGTAVYFFLGFRHARANGFLKSLPSPTDFHTLIKQSIPNGIQQLFFAAGFTVMYWIIGQVGTRELAASNVLINVMLVAILPGLGLGLAAATLVGQALGRKEPADAKRWGWDVVKVGMIIMTTIGIPMWAIPDLILQIFIHDPETIEIARTPMRLVGIFMLFEPFGMVLMNALLGAGDARRVMMVSIAAQWAFFLPIAYIIGPGLGFGLLEIWIAQGVYRIVLAVSFGAMWARGEWAKIKV